MANLKSVLDTRSVDAVLATARAILTEKAREIESLEQQAKTLAVRGTRDLKQVAAAPQPTLAERVAALLIADAQDARSAAVALGAPVGRVKSIMDGMRDGAKIHNIGSEVEPRWQHVLGDSASPADLKALVRRLISDRPFTHRELVIVTGCRENRISGVLADLREDRSLIVVNRGDGSKGRWEILPDSVKLAPLRKTARR